MKWWTFKRKWASEHEMIPLREAMIETQKLFNKLFQRPLLTENEAKLAMCLVDIQTLASCMVSSKPLGPHRDGCIEASKMIDRKIRHYKVGDLLGMTVGFLPGELDK